MRLAGKDHSLHFLETMCEKNRILGWCVDNVGQKIKITVTSACYAFVTLHQVLCHPTLSDKFSGLIMANIVEQSQPSYLLKIRTRGWSSLVNCYNSRTHYILCVNLLITSHILKSTVQPTGIFKHTTYLENISVQRLKFQSFVDFKYMSFKILHHLAECPKSPEFKKDSGTSHCNNF